MDSRNIISYLIAELDKIIGEYDTFASKYESRWFIAEFVLKRLLAIKKYLQDFNLDLIAIDESTNQTIAFLVEDRIPLEYFIDYLVLILKGYNIIVKSLSLKDQSQHDLYKLLFSGEPILNKQIVFTQGQIAPADLYVVKSNFSIITQRNYFNKKNILPLHDTCSAAILSGNESDQDLSLLASDICYFFGRGKGNVKKIFVPAHYKFNKLFEATEKFNFIKNHHHYTNSYQYFQTIYLVKDGNFLENNVIIIKEDKTSIAPTGVIFYQRYHSTQELHELLGVNDYYSILSNTCQGGKNKPFGSALSQCIEPDSTIIGFISNLKQ